MNILGDSVYAIQENFDEQRSIDSGEAQVHNSEASREESPDHFKSMIGGINGDILDPRMTMDLGALNNKQGSFNRSKHDMSSILPTSNENSSFTISGGNKSKNKKKKINKMMMSMALPKKEKYSLLGRNNSRNKISKKIINSVQRVMEVSPEHESPMRVVDEGEELSDSKKVVKSSFDLSLQTIQKRNPDEGDLI